MSNVNKLCDYLAGSEKNMVFLKIESSESQGVSFKNYNFHRFTSHLRSLKISSIEIMVKPSFVRANDIHFDENLGLGSKFPSCEENLFVYQALKTGDSKSEFYDVPVARHTLNLQSRDIDFHGRYAAQGYLVRG